MDYREKKEKKEKKFDFLEKKACAIKSLHEVNCFLYKFSKVCQIKKFIKK